MTKKEKYYITAIKNLIRKNNFLHLCMQLDEKEITQEQYDEELRENTDKYVIDMHPLKNKNDISIICKIVEELEEVSQQFNVDDVSELFSIKEDDLL